MAEDIKSKLPNWLTFDSNGVYYVSSDRSYPIVLKALGWKGEDRYELEVAYQCIKMKVQEIASALGEGPENGKTLNIIFESGDNKERWSQLTRPAGKGVEAATRGLGAKQAYERIRGSF